MSEVAAKGSTLIGEARRPPAIGPRVGMFVIEDEIHCEWQGQFTSLEEAVAELRRRATIPWDQPPNVAPCMSWKTCGREYVVIEFDDTHSPWKELRRLLIVEMSAAGVQWASGYDLPQ